MQLTIMQYPWKKEQSYDVDLCPDNQRTMETKDEEKPRSLIQVFYDRDTEFILHCEGEAEILGFYINNAYTEINKKKSEVKFWGIIYDDNGESKAEKRVFNDCPGYIELSLTVRMGGTVLDLRNEQEILALVDVSKDHEFLKQVENMAKFVWNNMDSFLLNGLPKIKVKKDLQEDGYTTLSSRIKLLEEIVKVYERGYGYFKANSRFCIKQTPKIEDFERLQYVTPATLRYIASHPEKLKKESGNTGIQVGRNKYQPGKTLVMQNEISLDIYENRVLLSFLRRIVNETAELKENLRTILPKKKETVKEENSGYVNLFSLGYMLPASAKELKNTEDRLDYLYNKLLELWGLYRTVFSFRTEPLTQIPRPTAGFLSIPQYNLVFTRIYKWFHYGIYDFSKESFMMSLINASTLYEVYVLSKMILFFKRQGYEEIESSKISYLPNDDFWKYKDTICNNKFVFYKNETETQITLYYQPVIYKKKYEDQWKHAHAHGLNLSRNYSVREYKEYNVLKKRVVDERRVYYEPDYIVKVERKGKARYLILDAKFSNQQTLIKKQVKDLVFKYLYAISPENNKEPIKGLCIVHGKLKTDTERCFFYGNENTPQFAELIPLVEGGCSLYFYKEMKRLLVEIEKRLCNT